MPCASSGSNRKKGKKGKKERKKERTKRQTDRQIDDKDSLRPSSTDSPHQGTFLEQKEYLLQNRPKQSSIRQFGKFLVKLCFG
jgi:hypothetical protein